MSNTIPFACECLSGKYIVVQAVNEIDAISRVKNEYGENPVSCRPVE